MTGAEGLEGMESPARTRRRSRYDRPRTFVSWFGLILGIVLGIGGSLYYTWVIDVVEEVDIAPWQLRPEDKNAYVVGIMLRYNHDGDLGAAIDSLVNLRLPGQDPIQQVAVVACDLASSGYVNSNAGLRAIRSMMAFYQSQGKTGCADQLIPADATARPEVVQVVLPTPTPLPPATKSPTPPVSATPTQLPQPATSPTAPPQRDFELVRRASFCDVNNSGVIEVRVVDFNGQGIPGQPVRVRWSDGDSRFVTGLKPERGEGYADFEMEQGLSYVVEMPGLSDPTPPIVADPCTVEGGQTATTSYEVVFRGS